MKNRSNPFSAAGLLLAPLMAVPVAAIHFGAWHRNPEAAVAALHAALLILPLSYFLTLFVGLPFLAGMRRLGLLNAASIGAGGLILGLAVGFLIGIVLFPLWDWYARLFYLTLGGSCGLGVALSYLLILKIVRY